MHPPFIVFLPNDPLGTGQSPLSLWLPLAYALLFLFLGFVFSNSLTAPLKRSTLHFILGLKFAGVKPLSLLVVHVALEPSSANSRLPSVMILPPVAPLFTWQWVTIHSVLS